MRVSNIRSGRICRLVLCLLVILPLLYLLANWSDHHKRVQEAYHARFGGAKFSHQRLENRPREVPKLVEGEFCAPKSCISFEVYLWKLCRKQVLKFNDSLS